MWGPAMFPSQIQANARLPGHRDWNLLGRERCWLSSGLWSQGGTQGVPYFMSLKRKTQDTLPLSRVVDDSACWFLQIWSIFYYRWWEEDMLSALRCFVTSMNHIMVLLCGTYYIDSLILLSYIPITWFILM